MTPVAQCHISIFRDIFASHFLLYTFGLQFQQPIHILSFGVHYEVDGLPVAFDPPTCPSSWNAELQSDNVIHPGEASEHHGGVGIHFYIC